MSDYSCHPIWASASVWNEGLFRDTNHHFGHFFVFCSTCFHQSKCFIFLKIITNRFGWAIQIVLMYNGIVVYLGYAVLGYCLQNKLPDMTRVYSTPQSFCLLLFVFIFFVEAEMGTFVVQLVTCMQHSRFSPICFQTCKLRSPSVWVYGNEMQKHGAFVFTHIFPKLK